MVGLEARVASVMMRKEAVERGVVEVEELYRDVMWSHDNQLANLGIRLRDLVRQMVERKEGKLKFEDTMFPLAGRIEAVKAEIEKVKEREQRHKAFLNVKWLALRVKVNELNEEIAELEGVPCVARVEESERRREVLVGEEVGCLKCHKWITKGRLVFENGLCFWCERNRVLRLEHIAVAKDAKMVKEFKEIVSEK